MTAGGTLTGLLIWAVAAALGLSVLVQASRVGYDVLRIAGACYLTWLGVTSLGWPRRRAGRPGQAAAGRPAGAAPETAASSTRWRRMYLNGLISNLLNPKIGVFFIAFLPGFIPAGSPAAVLSFTLGLGGQPAATILKTFPRLTRKSLQDHENRPWAAATP